MGGGILVLISKRRETHKCSRFVERDTVAAFGRGLEEEGMKSLLSYMSGGGGGNGAPAPAPSNNNDNNNSDRSSTNENIGAPPTPPAVVSLCFSIPFFFY